MSSPEKPAPEPHDKKKSVDELIADMQRETDNAVKQLEINRLKEEIEMRREFLARQQARKEKLLKEVEGLDMPHRSRLAEQVERGFDLEGAQTKLEEAEARLEELEQ